MNGEPIVIEYKGKMYSMQELCKMTGLSYHAMYTRYRKGERGDELCRKNNENVCKICGKFFQSDFKNVKYCSDECKKATKKPDEKKLSAEELAVKAKQAGMSYGQYVAKMMI